MSGPALRVEVRGEPRPQPRPRVLRSGRVVSTTGHAARWKRLVMAGIADALRELGDWRPLVDVPVSMRLLSRFGTRDASRWGKPVCLSGRGDFDNLAKLWADCLTARAVWGDDCQVAHAEQWQVWCRPEDAGAVCEVRELKVFEAAQDGAGVPAWVSAVCRDVSAGDRVSGPENAPEWLR